LLSFLKRKRMQKACPKCGGILYELNRLDQKGNSGIDPEFRKLLSEETEGLFVTCPHCKFKLPAVLISVDGVNRIIITE